MPRLNYLKKRSKGDYGSHEPGASLGAPISHFSLCLVDDKNCSYTPAGREKAISDVMSWVTMFSNVQSNKAKMVLC